MLEKAYIAENGPLRAILVRIQKERREILSLLREYLSDPEKQC